MLSKALNFLRCHFNHHDDIPISLDGKSWKVYCRRCERITIDLKGYALKEAQKEAGLKEFIRKQVATGATQIWATSEKEEKKK